MRINTTQKIPVQTLTLAEAEQIIVSLGEVSKMPCYSWNTSAYDCHRGGKLARVPGTVCSHCYARRGNFAFAPTKEQHRENAQAMDDPRWAEAMAKILCAREHSGHFRWFSSGDLRHLGDLLKICDVCRRTPHIRHWLPTHEISILSAFKRSGGKYPPNLTVRLSADWPDRPVPFTLARSVGAHGVGEVSTKGAHTCPSDKQDNMCQQCRLCWDRSVKRVVYHFH